MHRGLNFTSIGMAVWDFVVLSIIGYIQTRKKTYTT